MAAGTHDLHVAKRDVSPLGASRFEKPYRPSARGYGDRSDRHGSPASNLLVVPQQTLGSTSDGIKVKKDFELSHSAFSSSTSTNSNPRPETARPGEQDMESSAYTVGSDDFISLRWHDSKEKSSIESPVCVVSPDEWFTHFNSQDSLDLSLSSEVPDEDICPSRATLHTVKDIELFDSEGRSRSFGSFFDPITATHERQLIIFVRHFYCGACQRYLQALTSGISISDYFSIPIPTSIIIIGCGQPDMIPHYKRFTGCPFAMFADPSRELFKRLGMNPTLNIGGHRPDYMKDVSPVKWLNGQFSTIRRSLREADGIRKRDIFRGGNIMQIGGEFLFEDGEVIWAHRMRNYRDHTEVNVLRQLLELDE